MAPGVRSQSWRRKRSCAAEMPAGARRPPEDGYGVGLDAGGKVCAGPAWLETKGGAVAGDGAVSPS